MQPNGHLALIQRLAEAATSSSNAANKRWLAIATVAVFSVLAGEGTDGKIQMPFGFSPVEPKTFYLLSTATLALLAIAFGSAQAHQILVRKLAIRVMDQSSGNEALPAGVSIRRFWDMIQISSYVRVNDLRDHLEGRVHTSQSPALPRMQILGWLYYFILKTAATVYLALPAFALYSSSLRLLAHVEKFSLWILVGIYFLAAVAFVVLLHLLIAELLWIRDVIRFR